MILGVGYLSTRAQISKCKYGPQPRFTSGRNLNPGKKERLSFSTKGGCKRLSNSLSRQLCDVVINGSSCDDHIDQVLSQSLYCTGFQPGEKFGKKS